MTDHLDAADTRHTPDYFPELESDEGSPSVAKPSVVTVGADCPLSLEDIETISCGIQPVQIADAASKKMAKSAEYLDSLVAQNLCIYGVTTGYGPLADNHIDPRCSDQLQRNLVYHLASGVGEPLLWQSARAVVACRLQALSQGLSAVSQTVPNMLAAVLNSGLAPVIPEKGTVGASGDLTPLSHMALALMGEGGWIDQYGEVDNATAFARLGFAPLQLGPKEGLALVNGTSAMTGIAALNGALLRRLIKWSCLLSLANAEVFNGHRSAWHPLVGAARGQPGQQIIHDVLWSLLQADAKMQPHDPTPKPIEGSGDVRHDQLLPQDPYSIRCVPQLLGACLDMLEHHDAIVSREISAVTDNPLLFADEETLIHAGNFFGQHVSFASDSLTNAAIMVAVMLERQIARITDVRQNEGLPAFLQGNQTGLNSGFMGAQVTATALVAEMRTKAAPASIQSIPTNGNNQDIVTMGTIAARRANEILADVSRVAAIHSLCMAQAIDLREQEGAQFSSATLGVRAMVREISPFLDDDRPLSHDIENLSQILKNREKTSEALENIQFVKDALGRF
ncbi:MAG: aromatic amino acid ammonia-lyase [Pseudomonadota bacterium]